MTGAARLLGVHANTIRAWTDQGRLRCLRINDRGDRRYSPRDLQLFLARAGRPAPTALLDDRSAVAPQSVVRSAPADAEQHSAAASPAPRGKLRSTSLQRLTALLAADSDVPELLATIAPLLAEAGYESLTLVSANDEPVALLGKRLIDRPLVAEARRAGGPLAGRPRPDGLRTYAVPLADGAREVILLRRRTAEPAEVERELELLDALAAGVRAAAQRSETARHVEQERRRLHMLQALSSEISPQIDLERILRQLLRYASELFGAERAGVLRRLPRGGFVVDQSLNLSAEYCQALEHAPALPLTQQAFEEGRTLAAVNYPDDPRGAHLRRALLREGINTLAVSPLVSDGELLGALVLYHDRPRAWPREDLELLEQLAHMGAVALSNARNYSQMATWAAQLQSIQQLGARLTRLNSVHEIGQAIAAELNQLIDYHNVRVYRLEGDEAVPVAWRGEVGVYDDEDGSQLRVKLGQGITGWVARYGVAQYLPDAAADRRTETIPGTEDNMDESLLLAPMLYEDDVIGVIVLAKLGLHQFTPDDLRLLEIYASIAAQAMANADVTEQLRAQSEALERQLSSQRELLRMTESILGTLDTQALLESVADSLNELLHVDNICVDVHDEGDGMLRPIFARGVHAADYLAATLPADQGVSADVIRTGEAALVQDELSDERVAHFATTGRLAGALIVAPLRSGERIQGLLTIERLGETATFSAEEFELVKLFAAHVSIALRNAAAHRAVELRAETDPLTGLKNHGTFVEQLDELSAQAHPFALLMIDLDGFKRYNDARGHEAGNVMLAKLAGVLRDSCRETDEIFRYGGDEFSIILPATSREGALTVAHKVRHNLRAANAGQSDAEITCSVGVAIAPEDGRERSSIVLAADRACYAAKRSGGDAVRTAADGLQLVVEFDQRLAHGRADAENYSAA